MRVIWSSRVFGCVPSLECQTLLFQTSKSPITANRYIRTAHRCSGHCGFRVCCRRSLRQSRPSKAPPSKGTGRPRGPGNVQGTNRFTYIIRSGSKYMQYVHWGLKYVKRTYCEPTWSFMSPIGICMPTSLQTCPCEYLRTCTCFVFTHA